MIAQLSEIDHAIPTAAAAAGHFDYPVVTSRWVDRYDQPLDEPTATTPRAAVPVSLRDGAGAELACTVTDIHGDFRFDDVPSRDLALVFTVPSSVSAPDSIDGLPTRPPVLTWTGQPGHLRLIGTLG